MWVLMWDEGGQRRSTTEPTVAKIGELVRELNNKDRTFVYLRTPEDEAIMVIGGDAEARVMAVHHSKDETVAGSSVMIDPMVSSDGEMILAAGGQMIRYTARWGVSKLAATKALIHFLHTQSLTQEFKWESTA